MPAGATYEPLATTTFSASSSITFNSISSSYTDLRIVLTVLGSTANFVRMRFNSDTGTNYSRTLLSGDGSTATSTRTTNDDYIRVYSAALSTTIPSLYTHDIFSYAGSKNKTLLSSVAGDFNGSGEVTRTVNLWRSTSAINTILIYASSGTITGTATLYGIKAA
jgi:hypothetical protein